MAYNLMRLKGQKVAGNVHKILAIPSRDAI